MTTAAEIKVGTKLRFNQPSGELINILEIKNGKFTGRANGSEFCISGEVDNMVKSKMFTVITDEEYTRELDAFWASGKPKGKRVEGGDNGTVV